MDWYRKKFILLKYNNLNLKRIVFMFIGLSINNDLINEKINVDSYFFDFVFLNFILYRIMKKLEDIMVRIRIV